MRLEDFEQARATRASAFDGGRAILGAKPWMARAFQPERYASQFQHGRPGLFGRRLLAFAGGLRAVQVEFQAGGFERGRPLFVLEFAINLNGGLGDG